jgi:ABC-type transporter Mla subunit MlaD
MRFEDILASHAEDRELFRDSIKLLVERIRATDDKVDSIAEDVEDLRDDFRQFIER